MKSRDSEPRGAARPDAGTARAPAAPLSAPPLADVVRRYSVTPVARAPESDPRELVLTVDQFATEDGITFDPGIPSPSGSSEVDEDVVVAYLMADVETEIGGLPSCRSASG